jgi:hypothetical protein
LFTPSQLSTESQTPAEPRHWAVLLVSAGQTVLLPVQFSARSHSAAAARQTVLLEAKPSAGQAALEPVQVSAASQTVTAVRQVWPEERKVQELVQHEVAEPLAPPRSHCSGLSVTPSPQSE